MIISHSHETFHCRKSTMGSYENHRANLVELRGIEPLSESISAKLSPGADGYFALTRFSRSWGKPSRLSGSVASLCMVRSKLCARTDAASRRPGPGPQRSRAGRACLKRRPERDYRSQLIFKSSRFYGWSGHPPAYLAPTPPSKPLQPLGKMRTDCSFIITPGPGKNRG